MTKVMLCVPLEVSHRRHSRILIQSFNVLVKVQGVGRKKGRALHFTFYEIIVGCRASATKGTVGTRINVSPFVCGDTIDPNNDLYRIYMHFMYRISNCSHMKHRMIVCRTSLRFNAMLPIPPALIRALYRLRQNAMTRENGMPG